MCKQQRSTLGNTIKYSLHPSQVQVFCSQGPVIYIFIKDDDDNIIINIIIIIINMGV
jgi:hypothetical protein